MFKMTLPHVSALKPRINSFWIANSALGDLPEDLQGEAGRKQRVITMTAPMTLRSAKRVQARVHAATLLHAAHPGAFPPLYFNGSSI